VAIEIAFHVEGRAPLDEGLLVVGSPTLGLAGAIVAQHLVNALAMPLAGRVESPAFPLLMPVRAGRPVPAVRLHALAASCGAGIACSRLLVLACEFPPPPPLQRRFAEAVARWARERDTRMLVVPDGAPTFAETEARATRGVASSDAALAFLGEIGVAPLETGTVVGFTAALLEAGAREGLDTVGILGEVRPQIPDARGAAAIVRALGPALPTLDLEPGKLARAAEEIEAQARQMRERYQQQAPGVPMFS